MWPSSWRSREWPASQYRPIAARAADTTKAGINRKRKANKRKPIQVNASKNACICYQLFFRIGPFQWVMADSNKKYCSVIQGCIPAQFQRHSQVVFGVPLRYQLGLIIRNKHSITSVFLQEIRSAKMRWVLAGKIA
jgi:hypothetical protein